MFKVFDLIRFGMEKQTIYLCYKIATNLVTYALLNISEQINLEILQLLTNNI